MTENIAHYQLCIDCFVSRLPHSYSQFMFLYVLCVNVFGDLNLSLTLSLSLSLQLRSFVQQWSDLKPREREVLTTAGTAPMAAHLHSQPLLALAMAAHGRDRAQAAGVARGGHSSSSFPASAAAAGSGHSNGIEARGRDGAGTEKGTLCFTRYVSNSNKRLSVANTDNSSVVINSDSVVTTVTASTTDCEWCQSPLPIIKVIQGNSDGTQQCTKEATATHANATNAALRYCGWECAQAAALRSGSSSAIRRQVFALDRGVCALCRVDAHGHYLELQALTPPERFQRLLSGPFQSLLRTASSSTSRSSTGSSGTKKGAAVHGNKAAGAAAPRVVMQPMEADFWQVSVMVRFRGYRLRVKVKVGA